MRGYFFSDGSIFIGVMCYSLSRVLVLQIVMHYNLKKGSHYRVSTFPSIDFLSSSYLSSSQALLTLCFSERIVKN